MFDWDEHNLDHIARHGVTPAEAEDVFFDPRRMLIRQGKLQAGEARFTLVGRTDAGRLLAVVFTRRGEDIRVITARDASERERRGYRRRGD
jgi:hypothetical protein